MIKDCIHEVTAIQYTGENREEINRFLENITHYYSDTGQLRIPNDTYEIGCKKGNYVIKEKNGKVYIADKMDFKELYKESEPCECEPDNDDWKRNRSFSTALDWLKRGEKISRKGWNGKNMFVVYQKGYPDGIPCNKNTAEAWGMKEGELFKCEPYLQIKMVNGSHAMWVPSINDVLSNDWEIYEE